MYDSSLRFSTKNVFILNDQKIVESGRLIVTSIDRPLSTMDERTGPNNCTGPSWYGGPEFRSVFFLVRSVVRIFGPKLAGPVRGPEIRSET